MVCGVIWCGTLKNTLARVAGRVHRIGCKKRRYWEIANSSPAREKFVIALPEPFLFLLMSPLCSRLPFEIALSPSFPEIRSLAVFYFDIVARHSA